MKKFLVILIAGLSLISLSACAKLKKITTPGPAISDITASVFEPYSGPKAKVTLTDFDIRALKATADTGKDLRSMLLGELRASNHFILVEPHELGVKQAPDEAEQAAPKATDLLVSVTVSEFEPQASGGSAGVGGGGGVGSGALGGLLSTGMNKAHITIDMRIIDVATMQTLASTEIKSQASDVAGSITPFIPVGPALIGELSTYANTSMEKAIRISVSEAVQYILKNIRQDYYKY